MRLAIAPSKVKEAFATRPAITPDVYHGGKHFHDLPEQPGKVYNHIHTVTKHPPGWGYTAPGQRRGSESRIGRPPGTYKHQRRKRGARKA